MAIGTPTNAVTPTGASSTTVTTASFTPTAGALLIALVSARGASSVIPSIDDTLSDTWTPFSAGLESGAAGGRTCARLFWKVATADSQQVTCTSTGAGQVAISVTEITGVDSSDFSNFQETTSTTGDPSVTLATMGANSAGFYCGAFNAGGGATLPPTSYFELFDSQLATNHRQVVGYDLSTPNETIATTSNSTDTVFFGLELVEATAGQDIAGALYTNTNSFFDGTISTGAVNIDGALYTNDQTFYAASVGIGFPQEITAALFENSSSFFGAKLNHGLHGGLFTNSQTFFDATVDTGADQDILGARFTNTQTFFGAILTRGSVNIAANLFTNAQTFYGATVHSPDEQFIVGSLFTNNNAFLTNVITREGDVDEDAERRRRAGDAIGGERRRRKARFQVAKQLKALLEAHEAKLAPAPTPERREAIQAQIVAEIERGAGLLGPAQPEVVKLVESQVFQHYVPKMDWNVLARMYQDIARLAAEEATRLRAREMARSIIEEAARITKEIDDEDNEILRLVQEHDHALITKLMKQLQA